LFANRIGIRFLRCTYQIPLRELLGHRKLGVEVNSRGDEIHMWLDMLWEVVVIAGNLGLARLMHMEVIFSLSNSSGLAPPSWPIKRFCGVFGVHEQGKDLSLYNQGVTSKTPYNASNRGRNLERRTLRRFSASATVASNVTQPMD